MKSPRVGQRFLLGDLGIDTKLPLRVTPLIIVFVASPSIVRAMCYKLYHNPSLLVKIKDVRRVNLSMTDRPCAEYLKTQESTSTIYCVSQTPTPPPPPPPRRPDQAPPTTPQIQVLFAKYSGCKQRRRDDVYRYRGVIMVYSRGFGVMACLAPGFGG